MSQSAQVHIHVFQEGSNFRTNAVNVVLMRSTSPKLGELTLDARQFILTGSRGRMHSIKPLDAVLFAHLHPIGRRIVDVSLQDHFPAFEAKKQPPIVQEQRWQRLVQGDVWNQVIQGEKSTDRFLSWTPRKIHFQKSFLSLVVLQQRLPNHFEDTTNGLPLLIPQSSD